MERAKEESIDILKRLTGKRHIFFTDRGNTAIKIALMLSARIGKKEVFIQDQGGWMTYPDLTREAGLKLGYVETDNGVIAYESLSLDSGSVLLINSMPGYYALQEDMEKIYSLCREKSCILINDVSGSIGEDAARYGDMVIGSFGRWKPINLEYGGFIAYDDPTYTDFFKENMIRPIEDFYEGLIEKLKALDKRLEFLHSHVEKVKKDMSGFEIVHPEKKGLNVIIRFSNPGEQMKIEDYCKLKGYETTLCPRYIRILEPAVSIEIKRLTTLA